MGVFKLRKLSVFKSVFVPIFTYVNDSWVLDNDWKNTIPGASGRDLIFAKRSRCDTSRQSAQLWNFLKLWMSSHFYELRDTSCGSQAMWPERPRKERRDTSWWLQQPTGRPGQGGVTTYPTFLGLFLVWNHQDYLRSLLTVRHFSNSAWDVA